MQAVLTALNVGESSLNLALSDGALSVRPGERLLLLLLLGWLLRRAVTHDPQSSSGDGEHESAGHGDYLEQAQACGGRPARGD